MAKELKYNARLYKGTTSGLADEVFEENAIIYNTTNNQIKIGDGKTKFSALPDLTTAA